MSLITVAEGLFQRRSPSGIVSAIACAGIALAIAASNPHLKRTGAALALMASGAAMATVIQNDTIEAAKRLQEDYHLNELNHLQTQYEKRESSLKTLLDMAMAEAESFKQQITQMHEVLADDQLEKVSIFSELEATEKEYQYVLHELQEMAIAQAASAAQLNELQASSRLKIEQIQTSADTRIAKLEASLTQKTQMAAQMLSELEAEATGTFNQFNAKVTAQSELIEKLRRRVDSLRNENTALINQQTQQQIDRQIGSIRKSSIRKNSTAESELLNALA